METPIRWKELCDSLGLNRFGESEFRIVWGSQRLEWVGGLHCDYDSNGILLRRVPEVRLMPRYSTEKPRWILERWLGPEMYGLPEKWAEATVDPETGLLTQGPYPSRGDYEQCFTFENEKGIAIEPTEEMICLMVNLIRRSQNFSAVTRKAAILGRIKRDEDKQRKLAKDIADDALPAFRGSPFSGRHQAGRNATSRIVLTGPPASGLIQLPINREEN